MRNLLNTISIYLFVKLENEPKLRIVSSAIILFFLVTFCSSENVYAYDGSKYGQICKNLLGELDGDFGSLLTAAAGLGAVVASAAGGFKVAWSLVVVAVGSYTLKTYQEIWFDPC